MNQKLNVHRNTQHPANALWWWPLFSFHRGVNEAVCEAAGDFFPSTFVDSYAKAYALWQENLHRLCGETFNSRQMIMPWLAGQRTRPHINIEESRNSYIVRAGVAGSCPDDLDVSVADSALIIAGCGGHGSKKGSGAYIHHEACDASFSRTIALPGDADMDAASAVFDNGLLIVRIPKKERASGNIRKLGITDGADDGKPRVSTSGKKAA